MLARDDLQQVREVVREEVKDEVSQQLKPVNRKLNRLQKDMKVIVYDYSNAISGLRTRVEKIEEHLDLPQV
jgi:hypothetical protein